MTTIADYLQGIDLWLMYLINVSAHNPVLNWLMPIFHDDHPWRLPLLIIWLLVMILGGKRGRWIGLGALVMLALTDPISARIFKPLVGRIRPCNVLGNLNLWKSGAWMVTPDTVLEVYKSSFSFPSSHAANMAGQAFWWGYFYPRIRWVCYSLAFLIGISRIYDGVHWPSDVLGGWILGGLCFGVLWLLVIKWRPEIIPRAALSSGNEVTDVSDNDLEITGGDRREDSSKEHC